MSAHLDFGRPIFLIILMYTILRNKFYFAETDVWHWGKLSCHLVVKGLLSPAIWKFFGISGYIPVKEGSSQRTSFYIGEQGRTELFLKTSLRASVGVLYSFYSFNIFQ